MSKFNSGDIVAALNKTDEIPDLVKVTFPGWAGFYGINLTTGNATAYLPTENYYILNTSPVEWLDEESTETLTASAKEFMVKHGGVPEETVNYPAEEVRVTSSTGGAKGKKLARASLLPTDAMWELMEQYGKGADKYPSDDGLDNWRHGYEWSLSFDAAFRHMFQALNGEDYDEELNTKHVLAASWHMLTIAHFMNRPDLQHFDDRQSTRLKNYLQNEWDELEWD